MDGSPAPACLSPHSVTGGAGVWSPIETGSMRGWSSGLAHP